LVPSGNPADFFPPKIISFFPPKLLFPPKMISLFPPEFVHRQCQPDGTWFSCGPDNSSLSLADNNYGWSAFS
jgi:hypothetical protein